MDVDVPALEHFLFQADDVAVGLEIFQRDHGALLHHVAEVAGERKLAFTFGDAGLQKEDVAAGGSPCEAGDNARHVIALVFIPGMARAVDLHEVLHTDGDGEFFLQADLLGAVAHQFGDALLQSPYTALVGVVLHDGLQQSLAQFELLGLDAGVLQQLGQQMALCDLHFFLERVAVHLDDLHAVAQRRMDGAEGVCRGHEHHAAEVVLHLHVVVVEGVVLLRVQHFEERAGRVAMEVLAHLVDLVQNEERVARSGLLEALDQAAGHGADVRFAVPAYLGLIVQAAQTHAHVLAPEGLRHALAQAGLAHAGRAVQANDRGLHVTLQLQHGKVLDKALLHLLQAEVVAVEDLLGVLQVELIGAVFAPRQFQ